VHAIGAGQQRRGQRLARRAVGEHAPAAEQRRPRAEPLRQGQGHLRFAGGAMGDILPPRLQRPSQYKF